MNRLKIIIFLFNDILYYNHIIIKLFFYYSNSYCRLRFPKKEQHLLFNGTPEY